VTLNDLERRSGCYFRYSAKSVAFGAHCVKVDENIPELSALLHLLHFSERELTFTFAILLSPIRLSSVTFARPTHAVQIFGNISTTLGTLAIR